MDVMMQTPDSFSDIVKRKKIPPLNQLVEEKRRASKVSHHPSETKRFAKVKSNNVVEAEPSELHFSGFEVGKDYKKVVKLINVSPEVIHIHILPTQTKYFRTEYTKMSRLVPGLAQTITVHFSPNEWCYCFDSIQIHSKGEENLLVTIHAYPVIDDLSIPSHINMFPVQLGHRATCVIPLSCSCPVSFEFQVHCLKSHEAFNVYPLSGIIPAKGKTDLSVTFTPKQYGMAEITLQLVISQFNSKPLICRLTASCSPNLILCQQRENEEKVKTAKALQTEILYTDAPKLKGNVMLKIEKHTKIKSDSTMQSTDASLSNHARLAKMLTENQDKVSYKHLRNALSQTKTVHETRQMKEAAFENQVRVNIQKDRANHLHWQVQLGHNLFSAEQKIKILKEQELAASEYMINKDMVGRETDTAQSHCPKPSSHRIVRCAGQHADCTPLFYIFGTNQMQLRCRVLRLFQQTVRKVILQVRMNKRLLLLQKLASSTSRQVREEQNNGKYEKKQLLNMSSEKLLTYISPIFPSTNHPVEYAINKIKSVHVGLTEEDLTSTIPFFNLKVPLHYKLMGYQEVTVYDSKASFALNKQCRLLCTGAQNERLSMVMSLDLNSYKEKDLQKEETPEPDLNHMLFFKTPHNMLNPQNVYTLRLLNPAPSVFAFKPTPTYLESDPEFHLSPLKRHKSHVVEVNANSTPKTFLNRKDIIQGTTIWKTFPCLAVNAVSSVPSQIGIQIPHTCDPFSRPLLPLEAPPSMNDLPENIRREISETKFRDAECTVVSINPDMVQAEFADFENSSFKTQKEDSIKNVGETHEKLLESS